MRLGLGLKLGCDNRVNVGVGMNLENKTEPFGLLSKFQNYSYSSQVLAESEHFSLFSPILPFLALFCPV